MYHTWSALLLLFSSVSAFYPYHDSGKTHPPKRFYPISVPQASNVEEGSVKLDLHRVEKKDNKFSYILSNKPAAPNALAINQDGSDYSYFSTVSFGSKAQQMFMLIDTGSANTWVFSSECQSSTCAIHNTFGPANSASLQIANEPWSLSYGSGTVSGIIGTDTVAFANYSVSLGFGLAQNASDDFNNYPMDGILGLGRASSDQLGSPTIMQVLQKQANIAQNVIGVHLNRAADNTKDGEIIFGGIDTAKFTGALTYTATSNTEAWEIPVGDVLVNGVSANLTGRTAIIDTGTTFILMPSKDAAAIHSLIPGSVASGETYTIPCNTNVQLVIRISGQSYTISPKDYVGKPNGAGCGSTIIGHQAFGDTQWILGDVFLKNVYTVFDYDGKRIGFGMPGSGGSSTTVNAASTSSGASSATPSSTSASRTSSGSSSATTAKSSTSARVSSSGSSNSNPFSGRAGHGVIFGFWNSAFPILIAFSALTII